MSNNNRRQSSHLNPKKGFPNSKPTLNPKPLTLNVSLCLCLSLSLSVCLFLSVADGRIPTELFFLEFLHKEMCVVYIGLYRDI